MQELWIKKTVFKRLLIEDDEIETVKEILSQNTKECVDTVVDIFDKNFTEEYDQDETILPIEYSVSAVANER